MSDVTVDMSKHEITHYPHGAFSWAELGTTDAPAARKFYTELFGWSYSDIEMGNGVVYSMCYLYGKPVAGLMQMFAGQLEAGERPHWSSYITVSDIEATAAQVASLGGQVIFPPDVVGDAGRMCLIADPTGASVFLWQAKQHPGTALVNMPGTPGWYELYTNDVERAFDFYTKLLGWTGGMDMYEGARFGALHNGGEPITVIMPMRAEMGNSLPCWFAYFRVEDVVASAAKAVEMGGSLLIPPAVSVGYPYALVRDPQGAVFFIMSVPAT